MRPARREGGFTLVEVVVVLVVMVISVAVVAPALLPRQPASEDGLAEPLRTARRLALSRGETMYLDVAATGEWTIQGASSASEGNLAEGRLESFGGPGATVIASPLGTCAFDLRSAASGPPAGLDPLHCRLRAP